tara:strand:+ start:4084 stop:4509 length:426 start_codon:yes stop_codon:yes gene_type:complete
MTKRISKSTYNSRKTQEKLTFSLDLSSFASQTSEDELTNSSISIETTTADFSFKKKLLDQEVVQNPNILEIDNFLKLDNSPSLSKNKFDDESDPFYDFDEERSKVESMEKLDTNKQKASKIVSKLSKTKFKFNKNIKNYKE